mgnify:CR=1 FL=1
MGIVEGITEFLPISSTGHLIVVGDLINFPKELAAVMFKMWDKQPYDHIIWTMIKPKFEKPFKNNSELN